MDVHLVDSDHVAAAADLHGMKNTGLNRLSIYTMIIKAQNYIVELLIVDLDA
jgi:hypothetical protein